MAEDEIANLLDQCSPEELENILMAIEVGDDAMPPAGTCKNCRNTGADFTGNTCSCEFGQQRQQTPEPTSPGGPVPPSGPPPSSKRPAPVGIKRGDEAVPDEATVSMGEMKQMLAEHSAGMLNEVRKLIPYSALPAIENGYADPNTFEDNGLEKASLNLEDMTSILAQRDAEVKGLEAHLAELQQHLMVKDRRIGDLNGDLDCAIREVRHRQLDLEFQQLKLEERVRSNTDLEQAQRSLTSRVEDASRDSRHAALDVDLSRSLPPRTAGASRHVQGSLPWMLRKNRPLGASDAWQSP